MTRLGFAAPSGRKAVVLFSDGFGLYDLDNGIKKPNPRLMNGLQRLSDLANRSSVLIYAVDSRGIVRQKRSPPLPMGFKVLIS